ncbi:hypothetical protein KBA73_04975 [Patescibacteria group bacterium]|nr:hypothetical protein [Patescibacteria group bacterium]
MPNWLRTITAGWHRVFFWHRRSSSEETQEATHQHDHALVFAVTESSRPSRVRQLRFLNHVLSRSERQLFWGAFFLFFIAFGVGLASVIRPHILSVAATGGTVYEGLIGGPKFINPLYSTPNDVDRDLTGLIYAGLFRINEHFEPVPDLTDHYRWLDNGLTLEIALRQDIRFHDNIPVTADDVIFTYEAVKNPSWRSTLYNVFQNITLVRVDDRTVQFQLEKANPLLLTDLTLGILPAHLWADIPGNTAMLADLNLRPIGAGPYRASSFTRDSKGSILSYTLERFSSYHGIHPHIDSWQFRFFPDRTTALQALKNAQIDSLAFIPWNEAAALKDDRVQRNTIQLPQETIAFFNTKETLLKDEALRAILARSIDRAELNDLLKMHASLIDSPFPFLAMVSTTAPLNLEEAREALTKLGWVLNPEDNIRHLSVTPPPIPSTKKGGKPTVLPAVASTSTPALSLTINVADQPDLVQVADYLRTRWSLLGIRVTVISKDPDTLLKDAFADRGSYQILISNILLSPSQDLSPFWKSSQATGQGLNLSNSVDKDIDASLDRIRLATSTETLTAARTQIIKSITAHTPALFLARPAYTYLVNKRIKGVSDMSIARPADRLLEAMNWYISSTWVWK